MKLVLIILFMLTFVTSALAESPRYTKTHLKSEEDFVTSISKNLASLSNESVNSPEDLELLRNNLITALARPNKDNAQMRILPKIADIYGTSTYEEALLSITDESIFSIKDNKMPTEVIASYYFVLENLLTEIKSKTKENDNYKAIHKKISKARIKPTGKVKSFRRLKGMHKTEPLRLKQLPKK